MFFIFYVLLLPQWTCSHRTQLRTTTLEPDDVCCLAEKKNPISGTIILKLVRCSHFAKIFDFLLFVINLAELYVSLVDLTNSTEERNGLCT